MSFYTESSQVLADLNLAIMQNVPKNKLRSSVILYLAMRLLESGNMSHEHKQVMWTRFTDSELPPNEVLGPQYIKSIRSLVKNSKKLRALVGHYQYSHNNSDNFRSHKKKKNKKHARTKAKMKSRKKRKIRFARTCKKC
jgi:hypothetical protein